MNKFILSSLAFVGAVNAIKADTTATADATATSTASAEGPQPVYSNGQHDQNPYDHYNYYQHPGYAAPDYSHDYVNPLPGADFNRQVYKFNEDHPIWNQEEYAHRVKNEADILVALEALKESVAYLFHDTQDLMEATHYQIDRIISNKEDARANMNEINNTLIPKAIVGLTGLQGKCKECEYFIHDSKQALILYCQQFAFAPEMVGHCAAILNCRDTQLHYDYHFHGSVVPQPYHSHDVHDASHVHAHGVAPPAPTGSSHGIDLPVVGGNSYVAPGTEAELAAAAVDPKTVVLNVNGETIFAPIDSVDTDKTELACNDEGCALILDDGNPYNDIPVSGTV